MKSIKANIDFIMVHQYSGLAGDIEKLYQKALEAEVEKQTGV